jgi:MYND finger
MAPSAAQESPARSAPLAVIAAPTPGASAAALSDGSPASLSDGAPASLSDGAPASLRDAGPASNPLDTRDGKTKRPLADSAPHGGTAEGAAPTWRRRKAARAKNRAQPAAPGADAASPPVSPPNAGGPTVQAGDTKSPVQAADARKSVVHAADTTAPAVRQPGKECVQHGPTEAPPTSPGATARVVGPSKPDSLAASVVGVGPASEGGPSATPKAAPDTRAVAGDAPVGAVPASRPNRKQRRCVARAATQATAGPETQREPLTAKPNPSAATLGPTAAASALATGASALAAGAATAPATAAEDPPEDQGAAGSAAAEFRATVARRSRGGRAKPRVGRLVASGKKKNGRAALELYRFKTFDVPIKDQPAAKDPESKDGALTVLPDRTQTPATTAVWFPDVFCRFERLLDEDTLSMQTLSKAGPLSLESATALHQPRFPGAWSSLDAGSRIYIVQRYLSLMSWTVHPDRRRVMFSVGERRRETPRLPSREICVLDTGSIFCWKCNARMEIGPGANYCDRCRVWSLCPACTLGQRQMIALGLVHSLGERPHPRDECDELAAMIREESAWLQFESTSPENPLRCFVCRAEASRGPNGADLDTLRVILRQCLECWASRPDAPADPADAAPAAPADAPDAAGPAHDAPPDALAHSRPHSVLAPALAVHELGPSAPANVTRQAAAPPRVHAAGGSSGEASAAQARVVAAGLPPSGGGAPRIFPARPAAARSRAPERPRAHERPADAGVSWSLSSDSSDSGAEDASARAYKAGEVDGPPDVLDGLSTDSEEGERHRRWTEADVSGKWEFRGTPRPWVEDSGGGATLRVDNINLTGSFSQPHSGASDGRDRLGAGLVGLISRAAQSLLARVSPGAPSAAGSAQPAPPAPLLGARGSPAAAAAGAASPRAILRMASALSAPASPPPPRAEAGSLARRPNHGPSFPSSRSLRELEPGHSSAPATLELVLAYLGPVVLHKCQRCNVVPYCSAECQAQDAVHATECHRIQGMVAKQTFRLRFPNHPLNAAPPAHPDAALGALLGAPPVSAARGSGPHLARKVSQFDELLSQLDAAGIIAGDDPRPGGPSGPPPSRAATVALEPDSASL